MDPTDFYRADPRVTRRGTVFEQPTGALTMSDGEKASQIATLELQRIDNTNQPPYVPIGQPPTNTWTQGVPNINRGKIDAWQHPSSLPPPTSDDAAAIARELMKLAHLDGFLGRVREKITPKYWERRGGIATPASATSAAAGAGLGQGTAGAATIQPARCVLDCIHNPSTTTPATVALGELDGDPMPKIQTTIAAGGFAALPAAGLLFNRGIVLISSTMPLTFSGRTLD